MAEYSNVFTQSEFNLANKTMDRMGGILQAIVILSTEASGDDIPVRILRLYRALFNELYPWLKPAERISGLAFVRAIQKHPIINTGHSFQIPAITERNMELWYRWMMVKLKKHKLLSKLSEDPNLAYDME
jgi:hypothetical protein